MVAIRETMPTTVAPRHDRSNPLLGPYLVNRVRVLPGVEPRIGRSTRR